MENTYLIKVNEKMFKRILNLDITGNIEAVEIESISDMARVNMMIKLMKVQSFTNIFRQFGIHNSTKSKNENFELSSIFTFKNERFYSTEEVLNILIDLKERKSKKLLLNDTVLKRIDGWMSRVIWENKHAKNGS